MASFEETVLLGKETAYPSQYQPEILTPIPRQNKWAEMGIVDGKLPFTGVDIWNAWEVSWLNQKGKPVVAVAEIRVPADSAYLIESKSLKLYLNSLNQHKFTSISDVVSTIELDLSAVAQAKVTVLIMPVSQANGLMMVAPAPGHCIDELDIEVGEFALSPAVLHADAEHQVEEVLHSHLLKSNCPVTNQPDWATVVIEYTGAKINREALLQYLIGYRLHNDFHEQCVERIYLDLMQYCQCTELTVYARYLRRGGLDINPYRSNKAQMPENERFVRQ